ncbi:MAG: NYN domain-containing protein [Chloroflexota bacterium]|nr:NYN domain-containing protein [Chloroflexota bacterium]
MTDLVSSQRRIAMLIDGDNAQPSLMDKMIAETSKYGVVNIRRIYGDWTESTMNSWKQTLHTYAVQPIQQFRYTVGKNATDSALIIDAMDILYTSGVDGFCLVSSDSDYTKLAMRIREKNLFVMGIGRRLTPRAFVNACDTFVYTENLIDDPRSAPFSGVPLLNMPDARAQVVTISHDKPASSRRSLPSAQKKALPPPPVQKKTIPTVPTPAPSPIKAGAEDAIFGDSFDPDTENVTPNLETLFRRAFDLAVGENGWANLGGLGSVLRQLDPAFDPRTYGQKQLGLLVKAHPDIFETRHQKGKDGSAGTVTVRLIRERGGEEVRASQEVRVVMPVSAPTPKPTPKAKTDLPAPADVVRFDRFEFDDDDAARDEMAWWKPEDADSGEMDNANDVSEAVTLRTSATSTPFDFELTDDADEPDELSAPALEPETLIATAERIEYLPDMADSEAAPSEPAALVDAQVEVVAPPAKNPRRKAAPRKKKAPAETP